MNKQFYLIFFFLVLSSRQAFAYLDLGTTTVIIQSIVAFFVGGFVAIKIYWFKIKEFTKKLLNKSKKKN